MDIICVGPLIPFEKRPFSGGKIDCCRDFATVAAAAGEALHSPLADDDDADLNLNVWAFIYDVHRVLGLLSPSVRKIYSDV